MKLLHLSDLHIGKRVNEFSMLDDQAYILTKIINIIDDEKPEAVIIAGDVYDKSVPSAEAVALFDDFLVRLAKRNISVLMISGNHDSPERMAFGSRIFDNSGVYISPVFDGAVKSVTLKDEFGDINFYLLPFVKPANVRAYFSDIEIHTYSDAIKAVIGSIAIDKDVRNVLITHQFVTGATRSDSEDISVGGADNIDGEIFDAFDYVALGHIHGPQRVRRDTMRYCGTPLKYSFSESTHKKSVSIIEIFEKGSIIIRTADLIPKHDMREIKGTYMELTAKSYYDGTATDDYLHITLTDEEDIVDALAKLRVIYPNIMKLDYDNARTRTNSQIDGADDMERKSPTELFEDFYLLQNNVPISVLQKEFVGALIEKIWEGEK